MSSFLGALDAVGEAQRDPPTPLSARRVLPRFLVDALPAWVGGAGGRGRRVHPDTARPNGRRRGPCGVVRGHRRSGSGPDPPRPVGAGELVHRGRDAPGLPQVRGVRRDDRAAARRRADPRRARRSADHRGRARPAHRAPRSATPSATPTAPPTPVNPEVRAEALGMAGDAALAAKQMTIPARPRLIRRRDRRCRRLAARRVGRATRGALGRGRDLHHNRRAL